VLAMMAGAVPQVVGTFTVSVKYLVVTQTVFGTDEVVVLAH